MLLRIFLILNFLFFSQLALHAQNETKKWYFGKGTGLDFMTSPPSTIAVSSMTTSGGCASVADAAGNLLFYTNGGTIWNRLHNVMANGSGISGDIAAVQNCVILKQPGNSNLYYLFRLKLPVINNTAHENSSDRRFQVLQTPRRTTNSCSWPDRRYF